MLGCLITASSVAVIAILIGSFDSIVWRSLGTVLSAIIHIGIIFIVLSMTSSDDENPAIVRSTNFAVNSAMLIATLSFLTSVFGTWGILDSEVAFKLYTTYAITLFVILHAKTLMDIKAINSKTSPYVYANYAVMGVVALLIAGVVWIDADLLNGFYGRLLAASVIIDVTLSVIIAVMQRLYIQKHPELTANKAVNDSSYGASRLIVALLLFMFVVFPLIGVLSNFAGR